MQPRVLLGTIVLSVAFTLSASIAVSKPVFLYASRAGGGALDRDAKGGNPFATAVVELLTSGPRSFTSFKNDLIALTKRASHGAQQVEVVGGDHLSTWQILPKLHDETRVALVVVFAKYSDAAVGISLPGARHDYQRISNALGQAGFAVTPLIDPDRDVLAKTIEAFRTRSADADVAFIYVTGHGTQRDGIPRVVLPYVRRDGSRVLTVSELATSARARRANLIFYGACRYIAD